MTKTIYPLRVCWGFNEAVRVASPESVAIQSFEIRGYILNDQKILIGLDSCFGPSFFNSLGHFWYNSVIEYTALSNLRNYSMFISGFHYQIMSG